MGCHRTRREEAAVCTPRTRYDSCGIDKPSETICQRLIDPQRFLFSSINLPSFPFSPFLLVFFPVPVKEDHRHASIRALSQRAGGVPGTLLGGCASKAAHCFCCSLPSFSEVRCQKWPSASARTFLRLLRMGKHCLGVCQICYLQKKL